MDFCKIPPMKNDCVHNMGITLFIGKAAIFGKSSESDHQISYSFNPRPVLCWSSSIFFEASAFVRFSAGSSPASLASVCK